MSAIAWAGAAAESLVSVGADGRIQVTRYALQGGKDGGRREREREGEGEGEGEGGEEEEEEDESMSDEDES